MGACRFHIPAGVAIPEGVGHCVPGRLFRFAALRGRVSLLAELPCGMCRDLFVSAAAHVPSAGAHFERHAIDIAPRRTGRGAADRARRREPAAAKNALREREE